MQHLFLFAIASFLLNITPGPDMLYVATRSTGQGVKAGIVSALGIMAGCMVHVFAAMIGLSAIIASSAIAFSIIKYVGAAYLIYLGVRSFFSKENVFATTRVLEKKNMWHLFGQGAITNILNPKVALFFLAFLPQFIDLSAPHTYWQILFLGTWFNVSGTLVNIIVALLFGKIGGWLSRSAKFVQWQSRITGSVLVALGIRVAISSKK